MAKAYSATESGEQSAVLEWCRLMEGRHPSLKLIFHIPNEGKRSRITGARLKAEGLKSGVPDFVSACPKQRIPRLIYRDEDANGKTDKRTGRVDMCPE